MKEISRRTFFHEADPGSWDLIESCDAEIIMEEDGKRYYLHAEASSDPGWEEISCEVTPESIFDIHEQIFANPKDWEALVEERDRRRAQALDIDPFEGWQEELTNMIYEELGDRGIEIYGPDEED